MVAKALPGRGRRRLVWRLAAVALIGAAALAPYIGTALIVERDLDGPQAVLVLGSHEWERLPAAARLARKTPDAVVLLTKPARPTPENCHRCAERATWLSELGVEPSRIQTLPSPVTNTHDEATAALAYCQRLSIARLLVVTSPYHTRRALATFAAVFSTSGTAVGIRTTIGDSAAKPRQWWWNDYDRAYVAYEWAALAWYAVRWRVSPFVSAPAAIVRPAEAVARAVNWP